MEYRLTTPCTAQDLAPLRAGDTVLLSGVVYTARDQAHKRMIEALDRGEPLPFDLEGSAIYYVGPTPERPGEVIGSAGPTTSGRMDAMSPPPAGPGQQNYDRQGQAGCRRQGSRCPQRRGLSGCFGRCRCPDGQERPDAGGHRLARPRL